MKGNLLEVKEALLDEKGKLLEVKGTLLEVKGTLVDVKGVNYVRVALYRRVLYVRRNCYRRFFDNCVFCESNISRDYHLRNLVKSGGINCGLYAQLLKVGRHVPFRHP